MRRRLGGTRRIGGRRRGCASAAPVPSQVPALEPSWNPSQVRGTDRVRFRVLTKWTRSLPIRTAGQISLQFSLVQTATPFAYQQLAARAAALYGLGMSALAIAREIGVSDKTVAKAIRWARGHSDS